MAASPPRRRPAAASATEAALAVCVAMLALAAAPMAAAKIVEGTTSLSPMESEQYIAKFAFSADVQGKVLATFVTKEVPYFRSGKPHSLTANLLDDAEWAEYVRMYKEGSLCWERMKLAKLSRPIKKEDRAKRKLGVLGRDALEEFSVTWEVDVKDTSHYWYLIIADCELETYAADPTPFEYRVVFRNGDSHLPADEDYMMTTHFFMVVAMGAGAFLVALEAQKQYKAAEQVHLVLLLLVASFAMQAAASSCEFLHLWVYSNNGKGLRWRHSWLPLDFWADVLQNLSELLVSSILVAMSFGWTIEGGDFARPVKQKADLGGVAHARGMRKPSLRNLVADFVEGESVARMAVYAAGAVSVVQLLLEMLGRRFEDDFNSFHDHEHWPGFLLMLMRAGLCYPLWVGIEGSMKRLDGKSSILSALRFFGCVWLLSFPALVLVVAPLFAPYHRHVVVTTGALLLQGFALNVLAFFLLRHDSSYYKRSTLARLDKGKGHGGDDASAGPSVRHRGGGGGGGGGDDFEAGGVDDEGGTTGVAGSSSASAPLYTNAEPGASLLPASASGSSSDSREQARAAARLAARLKKKVAVD